MLRRSLLLAALVLIGLALWRLALDRRPTSNEQRPRGPNAPLVPEAQRAPWPEVDRATQMGPSEGKPENSATNEAAPAPASPPQLPAAPQPAEESVPLPPPERSGPVGKLKLAFEEEPRDSAAHDPESRIESEFRKSDIAPGTLKSVLCRQSVCKVQVLWTPKRALSFMAAFTRLSADFDSDIAIDPHDMAGSPQPLQLDVYLPRRGSPR
jgi:hypothetical protein